MNKSWFQTNKQVEVEEEDESSEEDPESEEEPEEIVQVKVDQVRSQFWAKKKKNDI